MPGSYANCSKLRQNESAVTDDIAEVAALHLIGDLCGGEGAFPGSAPDIDASGIDNQQPEMFTSKNGADGIERQLIVGRDKNRRFS